MGSPLTLLLLTALVYTHGQPMGIWTLRNPVFAPPHPIMPLSLRAQSTTNWIHKLKSCPEPAQHFRDTRFACPIFLQPPDQPRGPRQCFPVLLREESLLHKRPGEKQHKKMRGGGRKRFYRADGSKGNLLPAARHELRDCQHLNATSSNWHCPQPVPLCHRQVHVSAPLPLLSHRGTRGTEEGWLHLQ